MFKYPDAACDIIGAVKEERRRMLAWLAYIPVHVAELRLSNARDALEFLAAMVDGGGWPREE